MPLPPTHAKSPLGGRDGVEGAGRKGKPASQAGFPYLPVQDDLVKTGGATNRNPGYNPPQTWPQPPVNHATTTIPILSILFCKEDETPPLPQRGCLTLSALFPLPLTAEGSRPPDLPKGQLHGSGEGAPLPAFSSSRYFVNDGCCTPAGPLRDPASAQPDPWGAGSLLHGGSRVSAAPMGDLWGCLEDFLGNRGVRSRHRLQFDFP